MLIDDLVAFDAEAAVNIDKRRLPKTRGGQTQTGNRSHSDP
jgi:hypothetical protein